MVATRYSRKKRKIWARDIRNHLKAGERATGEINDKAQTASAKAAVGLKS